MRSTLRSIFFSSTSREEGGHGVSSTGARERSRNSTSTESRWSPPGNIKSFWSPLRKLNVLVDSSESLARPACPEGTSKGEGGDPFAPQARIPPLMKVLANRSKEPMSLRSLLRFAKRKLMDENVLFYLEVSSFKTAGGGKSEYLTHVKRIYDMYIMPASAREVNISGAIHIATSAAVNTVLRDHPVAVRGAPCGAERRHNIECCDHEEDDRAQLQTAAACSKARSRSSVNKTIGREGEGSAAVEPIDGAGDSASTTTTSHRRNVGGVTSNEFAETETPARSFYRETCPLPPVPPSSPASQTRRRSLARIQGGGPKVDISSLSESDLSALLAPRTLDAEWIVAIGAKDSEDQELETEDGEARGRNDGDQDSARPDFADYRYGGSTAKMCVRDSTQEIENLGLGLGAGPGGGFGDRTIFDAAQNEIYEVLRTEVYPRFVANAIACGGVSSSTTTSGGDCHAICQGLVAPLSPPPPPPSTPDLSTRSFKAVKGRGAGTGAAKK